MEYKPTTSDRVGAGSVVGSAAMPILHDKFHESVIVDLPFKVPPQAASRQLRGTLHSFLPASDKRPGADVEFHLLNEQEYSIFLKAKSSEGPSRPTRLTTRRSTLVCLPPSIRRSSITWRW